MWATPGNRREQPQGPAGLPLAKQAAMGMGQWADGQGRSQRLQAAGCGCALLGARPGPGPCKGCRRRAPHRTFAPGKGTPHPRPRQAPSAPTPPRPTRAVKQRLVVEAHRRQRPHGLCHGRGRHARQALLRQGVGRVVEEAGGAVLQPRQASQQRHQLGRREAGQQLGALQAVCSTLTEQPAQFARANVCICMGGCAVTARLRVVDVEQCGAARRAVGRAAGAWGGGGRSTGPLPSLNPRPSPDCAPTLAASAASMSAALRSREAHVAATAARSRGGSSSSCGWAGKSRQGGGEQEQGGKDARLGGSRGVEAGSTPPTPLALLNLPCVSPPCTGDAAWPLARTLPPSTAAQMASTSRWPSACPDALKACITRSSVTASKLPQLRATPRDRPSSTSGCRCWLAA